jgi:hypothetical protein
MLLSKLYNNNLLQTEGGWSLHNRPEKSAMRNHSRKKCACGKCTISILLLLIAAVTIMFPFITGFHMASATVSTYVLTAILVGGGVLVTVALAFRESCNICKRLNNC